MSRGLVFNFRIIEFISLSILGSDFVVFFQNYPHPFLGGKYVSFFEDWEILNNELNVLKLEFIVNIMDNKVSSCLHGWVPRITPLEINALVVDEDTAKNSQILHMYRGCSGSQKVGARKIARCQF